MDNYVYKFYRQKGKIKCSELNLSNGQIKHFKKYTDALNKITKMHAKTKKIKSDSEKNLIYMVGDNKIILRNFPSLIKNENMSRFYHYLRKKVFKTNKVKANMAFFTKNPKLIMITSASVVLSAAIAVSGVNAQDTNSKIWDDPNLSYQYMNYYDEQDKNLSYDIDFECGSQLDKCQSFFQNNSEEDNIIRKYSDCYEVDCNLIRAIAYQESGGNHNVSSNPCAYGIMQIEKVHLGSTIQSYNFVTDQIDKITITEDVLKDKKTNIQVGIMIYRNNLDEFNNNPILALQAYNFGVGGVRQILKLAAADNNIDISDLINDPTNQLWLDYRHYYKYGGDKEYAEHVMRYCPEKIQNYDKDGNVIEFNFSSYTKNKKK